jgi:hypothetical protein
LEEAEGHLNRALIIGEREFGDIHPDVADTLVSLGLIHEAAWKASHNQWRHEAMVSAWRRALDTRTRHYGLIHDHTIWCIQELAYNNGLPDDGPGFVCYEQQLADIPADSHFRVPIDKMELLRALAQHGPDRLRLFVHRAMGLEAVAEEVREQEGEQILWMEYVELPEGFVKPPNAANSSTVSNPMMDPQDSSSPNFILDTRLNDVSDALGMSASDGLDASALVNLFGGDPGDGGFMGVFVGKGSRVAMHESSHMLFQLNRSNAGRSVCILCRLENAGGNTADFILEIRCGMPATSDQL